MRANDAGYLRALEVESMRLTKLHAEAELDKATLTQLTEGDS